MTQEYLHILLPPSAGSHTEGGGEEGWNSPPPMNLEIEYVFYVTDVKQQSCPDCVRNPLR